MKNLLKFKQLRFKAIVGFIAGVVMSVIGLTVVIPIRQGFGIVWTLFAVLIAITQGIGAFTDRGIVSPTMEVEDLEHRGSLDTGHTIEERLVLIQQLKEKQLITEEEYQEKRKEIIDEL